jgi:putative CocE/NonD family hydrolase
MDTMSASTSETFKDVIEWAAEQSWSNGRIGLLGISYYAGTQWRVAARRPKGLCCIIPWEGMSDYYRDRCRHGGILSNVFIDFWWNRQVVSNQYGLPGRAARRWGPDTIEGDRTPEQLAESRNDQRIDNVNNHFYDDHYYASRAYDMKNIEVPLLSVGNWGGILLHLRGNVEGFVNAGSKQRYLRFITGRHDLPFYTPECVALQESFLEAFLKDNDPEGWSTGKAPRVGFVVRKGDVGYNDPAAEKTYPQRFENEWPIERTKYVKYYLTAEKGLTPNEPSIDNTSQVVSYETLGNIKDPCLVQFQTEPFENEIEFTGHFVAHLNVSVTPPSKEAGTKTQTMDTDLFLTVRHISPAGAEVLYTGTVGDPVPVTKGWLRVSLRKVNTTDPKHHEWHPHREYLSTDVEMLTPGEVYEVDVEIWPSNVVVQPGGRLVFEIASGDTQGAGLFEHNSPEDRPEHLFGGMNHVHFGNGRTNWLLVPQIP